MSCVDFSEFNRGIVEELPADQGVVAGPFAGAPNQEKTDRVIPVIVLTRA